MLEMHLGSGEVDGEQLIECRLCQNSRFFPRLPMGCRQSPSLTQLTFSDGQISSSGTSDTDWISKSEDGRSSWGIDSARVKAEVKSSTKRFGRCMLPKSLVGGVSELER